MNISLCLARNYSRIFCHGHYLFREANDFRRAKLQESCGHRITDDAEGHISPLIYKPNECIYSLFLFFLYCSAPNKTITLKTDADFSTATSITIKLFLSQTNLSLNTFQLKSTLKGRLSSHCKQCFKIREYHRGKGIFDHAPHLNQSRVSENVCKYRYLPKKVRNTQLPKRQK